MTREEREQALEWFKNRPITMSGAKKMYDLAIAALEQLEPCEDAVSRKLMYELGATCMARRDENGELVALGSLDALPSAQPEPQWIPCSERLPEEPYGCLVTVWDTNPITMDEFENILPYFVGWDGEQWNDDDGEQCPFEVTAWMPLPKPYEERQEE